MVSNLISRDRRRSEALAGLQRADETLPGYLSARIRVREQDVNNRALVNLLVGVRVRGDDAGLARKRAKKQFLEGNLKNYAYRKIKICTFNYSPIKMK
jgi:hypothetical protein